MKFSRAASVATLLPFSLAAAGEGPTPPSTNEMSDSSKEKLPADLLALDLPPDFLTELQELQDRGIENQFSEDQLLLQVRIRVFGEILALKIPTGKKS